MSSQSPPPFPGRGVPGSKQRLRGRVPLLLAVVFGVAGLVLIGVGSVLLAHDSVGKVDDFTRIPVGDEAQSVRFERAGQYVAYLETPGSGDEKAGLQLVVRQGTRAPVDIYLYDTAHVLRYDTRTAHGEGEYHFTLPRAGRYDVLARGVAAPRGTRVAFGESIARGSSAGGALVITGVALLVAMVALTIVGLGRRRRHRKALEEYYRAAHPA